MKRQVIRRVNFVLLWNLAVLLCDVIDFGFHCSAFCGEKKIIFAVGAFIFGIRIVCRRCTVLGLECVLCQ